MNRRFASLFFAVVLVGSGGVCLTNARTIAPDILKETIESGGKKHSYYLYIPENLKSSVPLLLTLHGSGRDGQSLVDKWKELAAKEGFIVVGPNALNSRGWSMTEDGPSFLRDLVEHLKNKHPVDPRKVFLFGHSAGAVYALNLSMLESEYFAATAVHAGSWRSETELALISKAARKTPIAIFVGDNDQFFPLEWVKTTASALKERGFPFELTVIKGHTHWYYDRAPEINRNAWDFLKHQQLTAAPKYSEYIQSVNAVNDVNNSITEINKLRTQVNQLFQRFSAKEQELNGKDFRQERAAVVSVAREEVDLLTEAAALLRSSAQHAEKLSKANLPGSYPLFFQTIAQADLKRAEMFDALRQSSEAWLSEDSFEAIVSKRTSMREDIERLRKEADAIEMRAEQIRSGNP
jgi:predicted esterase